MLADQISQLPCRFKRSAIGFRLGTALRFAGVLISSIPLIAFDIMLLLMTLATLILRDESLRATSGNPGGDG